MDERSLRHQALVLVVTGEPSAPAFLLQASSALDDSAAAATRAATELTLYDERRAAGVRR